MATASYDPGNPYPSQLTRPPSRVRGWVFALPVLVVLGLFGWWLWGQAQTRATAAVEKVGTWSPTFVEKQYEPEVPPAKPDHDAQMQKLIQELLAEQSKMRAEQEALRKALDEAKKTPKAAPAPAAAKLEKPKPVRWVLADVAKGTPPFPKPEPVKAATDPQGKLIVPAHWEIPQEPWKVLYSGQRICGQMAETTDSRLPSQVKIQVGQPTLDRFGQGHVLIPQFATVIGAHDGNTTYGDTALLVGIQEVQFPGPPWGNGEVLTLPGKMTDKSGAVGAGAHINWHWGRMAIGVLVNAALGIGPRLATGSVSGYNPNVTQEIARELAYEAQQALRPALRQTFFLKPTLTFNTGDHVCIQLQSNVSLARPPTVVK